MGIESELEGEKGSKKEKEKERERKGERGGGRERELSETYVFICSSDTNITAKSH